MRNRLDLKREVLTELSNAEMGAIVGAAELLTTACQDTSKTVCVSVECLPSYNCTIGRVCG